MSIAGPLGRHVNLKDGGAWSNLLASHPPMADRIAALEAMAFQHAPRERSPRGQRGGDR